MKLIIVSILILLILLSRKTVEKPSKENLKLISNILPKKSGNPESLKNDYNSWNAIQIIRK